MNTLERHGIVVSDGISFIESTNPHLELEVVRIVGRVWVASGAVLNVDKVLDVDGSMVLGRRYAYHSWMPDEGDRELFRYDNCYGDFSTLHRHRFFVDGTQHSIEPVAYEELPNLDLIIREAHELGLL